MKGNTFIYYSHIAFQIMSCICPSLPIWISLFHISCHILIYLCWQMIWAHCTQQVRITHGHPLHSTAAKRERGWEPQTDGEIETQLWKRQHENRKAKENNCNISEELRQQRIDWKIGERRQENWRVSMKHLSNPQQTACSYMSLPERGSRDAAFLWLLSLPLFTQTNKD